MSLKLIESTLFFCCDSSKIVFFNGMFDSVIAKGDEQTFVEQTVQASFVLSNTYWGICEAFLHWVASCFICVWLVKKTLQIIIILFSILQPVNPN